MNTLKTFTRYIVIATILFLLMGYEWWSISPTVNKLTDNLPVKIKAVFEDSELQPWIMGLFIVYITTFIIIQILQHREISSRWRLYYLAAAQALAATTYFRETGEFGAQTSDALVLSGGCALGLAFAYWLSISHVPPEKWLKETSLILVLMLAASSICTEENWAEYSYREARRATGIWKNPNTYGLIMGFGLVLALSLLAEWIWKYLHSKATTTSTVSKKNLELLVTLVSVVLLLKGLIQSLSRGAWLGTALALVWLTAKSLKRLRNPTSVEGAFGLKHRFRQLLDKFQMNLKSTTLVIIALGLLMFWMLRHVQNPKVRRVFTAANTTDLSCRNRLIAYEQALQMMKSRPLEGYHLSQWLELQNSYYKPLVQNGGSAIALNDYLSLGVKYGFFAMLMFLSYFYLTLFRRGVKTEKESHNGNISNHEIKPVMIVLLVGFWLDGGLFNLSLAIPFWLLIETTHCSNS